MVWTKSQRHNSTVVKPVVDLIVRQDAHQGCSSSHLWTPQLKALISIPKAVDVSLELRRRRPSFSEFVRLSSTISRQIWDSVAERLPEADSRRSRRRGGRRPSDDSERRQIRDWIRLRRCPRKGSVALFRHGLGVHRSQASTLWKSPAHYSIAIQRSPDLRCVHSRASLACVREQGKVDAIAEPLFTPGNSGLLTLFRSYGHRRVLELRSPLQTSSLVVCSDWHYHQNEEFSAIVHR